MATGAHGCAPWASIFCPPGLCAKYSVCGLPQCGAGNSARGRLSAGWTAGADGLLEKGQFLYRVVLPVSRPERGAAQYSACGNQGIAEFHCVALSVASEVIACLAACFRIDRNACQSTEQVVEGVLFRRARPGPKLGGADRRIQDGNVGAAQLGPSAWESPVIDSTHPVSHQHLDRAAFGVHRQYQAVAVVDGRSLHLSLDLNEPVLQVAGHQVAWPGTQRLRQRTRTDQADLFSRPGGAGASFGSRSGQVYQRAGVQPQVIADIVAGEAAARVLNEDLLKLAIHIGDGAAKANRLLFPRICREPPNLLNTGQRPPPLL